MIQQQNLCLECGLCCNGVIFADVKLRPQDDVVRLQSLGLQVSATRLRQPCAAYAQGLCSIYAERPACCREFECLLLKSVNSGEVSPEVARKTISLAQARAQKVRNLLHLLGDEEEELALTARFRRIAKRFEKTELDEPQAAIYADLTLTVQDLNMTLSHSFLA